MIYTNHCLDRMDEREVKVIAVEYALRYGSKSIGDSIGTYRYVLTKEKIHEIIFEESIARDDMLALTAVEKRGGLIVIVGEEGTLITVYYKYIERKRDSVVKHHKGRVEIYPILEEITASRPSQSIRVPGISRRRINQACQYLKYRHKEVH